MGGYKKHFATLFAVFIKLSYINFIHAGGKGGPRKFQGVCVLKYVKM